MSDDIIINPYHMNIISKRLTRANVLPAVVEEVALAFEEHTNVRSGSYRFNYWQWCTILTVLSKSGRLWITGM
jgi:hypothetical protein